MKFSSRFASTNFKRILASQRRAFVVGTLLLAATAIESLQKTCGQDASPVTVPTQAADTSDTPTATTAADFIASRTPTAAVTISSSTQHGTMGLNTQTLPSSVLHAQSSMFSKVSLTAGSNGGPPAITVALTYGIVNAGRPVLVRSLDGGQFTGTDGAGKSFKTTSNFLFILDANGTASFSFQAPPRNGTYRVVSRIDGVSTTMPVVVSSSTP